MILRLIKKLFFANSEIVQDNKLEIKRSNIVEPDFIDYDGMGNQGRFPSRSKVK